ncbi:peroxisomal membrane protein 2 [Fistulifera solaris]|uniref:Peroxisomal membrane protein 2 n=1 Tax=Fistulifera solaris TaxID=1519565 RepID=A0A1Z5K8B4_FISSO|nr:peroxisomal membrane protein 2 [Fistulifera solaris]|eukprot:GAX22361.1 peroxisomal membrane protein 2 [Fistulifera solaris]
MGPEEAWAAYNTALQTDPLITKSITASVILGAADLTGQALENRSKISSSIDWARSARFAFFGLVLQAPWNHFYYLLLDGVLPPTEDPFTATNFLKVVIDQGLQAPLFTILIFVFLGALEGKQLEAIQQQLQKDYKNTMLANWKVFIPATAINIGFVPPIFRVLFLNLVFFGWSIYLSLLLNKDESEQS